MSEQRRQQPKPPAEPAQEGLFDVQPVSGYDGIGGSVFTVPQAGEMQPAVPAQEVTAPVVDVRQRAGHLIRALHALAQANKRHGFAVASQTPGLREPIERRYQGDHLKGVQGEAAYNKQRNYETARQEFTAALRLGNMDDLDNAEIDRLYISFKHTYGGTKNHKALDKLRANLRVLQAIPGPEAVGDTYTEGTLEDTPSPVLPAAVDKAGEPAQPIVFDPKRRRAFGSAPTITALPHQEAFTVSAEDEKHISPAYIEESLVGNVNRRSYNRVALNAAEYKTIPLDIRTLVERATARAAAPHKLSAELRQAEVEVDAPVHVLQRQRSVLESMLEGLHGERERLGRLQGLIEARGFARTDEATVRELTAWAFGYAYKNMLDVVAHQRGWTPEQRQRADQALYNKLYEQGSSKERMESWAEINAAAARYARRRHAIVKGRKSAVNAELQKRLKIQQAFRDERGLQPVND